MPVTEPALAMLSSSTVNASSPAVKSATAATVTLMTWVSALPSSSVTVTVKLSEPLKFASGVYVQAPVTASIEAVPLLLAAVTVKFGVVMPSAVSVAIMVPDMTVSSSPLPLRLPPKLAASLLWSIVSTTVCVELSPLAASVTV